MADNMKIWNEKCSVPPEYLKAVSFGSRSFTAIDPQWQIMAATELFGPVGEGWGWTAKQEYIHAPNGEIAVVAHVSVWHGDKENSFGPFTGCRKFLTMTDKGSRWAEDAPKMATTDGLTKALSHIGIGADIFLGKMDGNKYADPNTKTNSEGW